VDKQKNREKIGTRIDRTARVSTLGCCLRVQIRARITWRGICNPNKIARPDIASAGRQEFVQAL